MVERRGGTRYDLAFPVHIGEARGFTRNIGIGGALVVSPVKFAAGDVIDIVIDVAFSDPDTPTRLRCSARVRRVHKLRTAYALALEFTDVRVMTAVLANAIPAGKPALL
jgi:hypothetical protein